ncbi:MAG: hypothetical protein ACLQVY_22685 [Limisphaerales bacterium]
MRNRRQFLKETAALAAWTACRAGSVTAAPSVSIDPALAGDWQARWKKNILGEARNRTCDREMSEEIGWVVSPVLYGFYYGWRATGDPDWMLKLVDWGDAWTKRAIKEPDGFAGWPKSGTGGAEAERLYTDSLLGEAMGLRPLLFAAAKVRRDPALRAKFGATTDRWVQLAESTFDKWIARGCWREVKEGGVWVVPTFGMDRQTGQWTDGYARRGTDGLSNPDNKQNLIATWLISLYDVTGKPVYREHAEKWWRVMKSRLHTRDGGKYFVWNYWEPAGPWDYKEDGSTRHWVGVHPNGGYYGIDLEGIVTAFEHQLVFSHDDLQRLIATNRDFMWNQQTKGAKFQRIDGGEPDERWKNTPGVLWAALVPYDETLRAIFVANHDPTGWGALASTPWFLACAKDRLG